MRGGRLRKGSERRQRKEGEGEEAGKGRGVRGGRERKGSERRQGNEVE